MSIYHSQVNTNSDTFQQNRKEMLGLIDQLHALQARAKAASERAAPRFARRGQLLPRERMARLLDPGAPFLELCNMSGYLRDSPDPEKSLPGASVIAGIGFVSGVRCLVLANDSGINAGALTSASGEKVRRCQTIALENNLPFVHLVESAGANLLRYRVELFVYGGKLFRNLA